MFSKSVLSTTLSTAWTLGLLASLAMTGCTKKSEDSAGGSKSSGKTFVYCSEGSPSIFNPQLATDGPTFNATAHTIYNTLVDFKIGTTDVEPALAEAWTISKDGLTYTFNLRKGVKYHSSDRFTPQRDFNADDVLFSFNRMRLKDHPYHLISGGNYEYFTSMEMGKLIKDIVKVDDYTVRIVLSKSDAPFLANLAMDFASILSAEYGDVLAAAGEMDKIDTEPIGTGPFVYQRYQKDTMIRYRAHDHYFRGRPKLDQVVFSITPDPSVRTQKLRAKECHLIAEPSPQDIESLRTVPHVQVLDREGLNVGYLAMNTEKAPFDKKEVRQAIHHALNRESYMEAIYIGRASIAKNPIPPTIWSYNENTKDYDYNIEKAKELLKKAGFPNGFEAEIWTLPVSRPYNPAGKKMGELMQADLAQIGVRIKLVTYDWPTYLDKSSRGEHQMVQLGWTGDNGDPDNFMNVLLGCSGVTGGSNVARWCHKPFNDLVQQAKLVTEKSQRTDLYKKAQLIFKEEAPWVTLAHARVYRAIDKSVKGYVIHPLGTEFFAELDLE